MLENVAEYMISLIRETKNIMPKGKELYRTGYESSRVSCFHPAKIQLNLHNFFEVN